MQTNNSEEAEVNKRDQAICDWVDKHRPDLSTEIRQFMTVDAPALLMSIAFEAGRKFQHDNPSAPLNNPNIY